MVLKKLIKNKKAPSERYSIHNASKCPSDVFNALQGALVDYCNFNPSSRLDGKIAGHPSVCWAGKIEDNDGYTMNLEVQKSYFERGILAGLELNMEYDSAVSDEDLDVVRRAITGSGLERIEA